MINSPNKARWLKPWNIRRANWIIATTWWNTHVFKYLVSFRKKNLYELNSEMINLLKKKVTYPGPHQMRRD
jgi:hypothetical protein